MDGELWHLEARRDDGTPTMFRIRELDPKKQLTRIFVVELPYPKTELSRLPSAESYRRLAEFEEQWLRPACTTLGWEFVGSKIEDGSSFLYMYGSSNPNGLVEKLSPFDAALGFYDDEDPEWAEYATLRELLDKAKSMPDPAPAPAANKPRKAKASNKPPKTKPKAKAKPAKGKTVKHAKGKHAKGEHAKGEPTKAKTAKAKTAATTAVAKTKARPRKRTRN